MSVAARRLLRALGWVGVAGLVVAALVRLVGWTGLLLSVQLQAVAGPLLLSAPALVLLALLVRSRALAVSGLVLCLAAGAWLVSVLPSGEPTAGGCDLRVTTANLKLDNDRVDEAAAALVAQDADVVVLHEVTPGLWSQLDGGPLTDTYSYRVLDVEEGFHGSAVLSRLPTRGGLHNIGSWDVLETRVELPDGRGLTMVAVHGPAPVPENGATWWREVLEELAVAYGARSSTVLAGDFNATPDHRPFRALVGAGLRESWDEAGEGLGGTFPAGTVVPPLLRLDHVLLSRGLGACTATTVDVPGSDHLGVTVDVATSGGRRG